MLIFSEATRMFVTRAMAGIKGHIKPTKRGRLLSGPSIAAFCIAFAGAHGNALAIDFAAGPIRNNNHAKNVCPNVCRDHKYHWHGQWTTTASGTSVCGCGWGLDKAGATFRHLQPAEQARFDTFQNAIANEGLHPRDAADRTGDTNYKRLRGTRDQYEIRLSQHTRATFRVLDDSHTVKILEVGGHT